MLFSPSGIDITDGKANAQESLTQQNCYWSGTAPFCAGGCSVGESTCGYNPCGDGKCCATGVKAYCCTGACPDSKLGTCGQDFVCFQMFVSPVGLCGSLQ